MKVKISQAMRMVATTIKCGLVPFLVGSPGCGKSQAGYQVAELYNLKVIDLRLSQCDPTDLLGFPHISGNRAGYVPMETFPIEGDPLPVNPANDKPYSGWLLFLDEFNSASTAVQAAAYKLVLDKMVGIRKLHKNCAILCAGNLETDNAIVNSMSTALQSRLVHMELELDVQEWIDWSQTANVHHFITDHIKFKPGNLFTFKPDHSDNTYACPRTWEFASRILAKETVDGLDLKALLSGTISEGVAREFIGFCEIYKSLPKPEELVNRPESVMVPSEPSVLYALTGCISHHASKDTIERLMMYVNRLPAEFQVVALRDTVRRHKPLLAHPAVQKWIGESSDALF